MKIGDLDNQYGYGFVTSDNPDLLNKMNRALKALKTSGELKQLKDKWWKSGNKCENAGVAVMANTLSYLSALLFSFILVRML